MSEQRFYITDTGLGLDTVSDEMYSFGDEEDFCRLFDKLNEQQATIENLRKWIKAEQKQVVKRDAFIKQKGLMSDFVKELEDE